MLETVDVQFLRRVLKAPRATPKEMLYLESGCVPFRDLMKKRRISFLHYILNEKPDSMINKFLKLLPLPTSAFVVPPAVSPP